MKKPFNRWYVIRVEEYLEAYPEKRLQDHQKNDVFAIDFMDESTDSIGAAIVSGLI